MLELTKNELIALNIAIRERMETLEKENYPKEEHEYVDLLNLQEKIEKAYNNKDYIVA